jgi:spermidine/putrescine transport system substrate-binding protein
MTARPGRGAGDGNLPFPPARGRPFTRRSFLGRALAVAVAAPTMAELLAACGDQLYTSGNLVIASPEKPVKWPLSKKHPIIDSGQTPSGTLKLYNYADYLGPGVLKSFEEEFDVDISVSTFNDTDEALTKIASGAVTYDIYFPSYDQLGKMVTAELLRPLNHDYITNIDNLWPQFKNPWYDQGWQYSVPYTVYTTGIGWRTDMVEEDISQRDNPYTAFWDPQYRENLAIIDDFHTAMGMVLLANGIDDVNTGNKHDLDILRQSLIDLGEATSPKVTITMYNQLPEGQYGLAQMWSGDIVNAVYYLPKGTPSSLLRYWFPPDGKGLVDNDLMVMLGTGENPVAAHYFINYMLDAEVAAKNFGFIGYQPPQRSISPESLVEDGFVPPNLETASVKPEYFLEGSRLLELPPIEDGQYHEIWQEFKANG